MGCVCCSLSSFISIVLHALERITLCTVCAMLVCCVLFTILGVLIMGVGIGYHYCEVQSSVAAMANAAKAASSLDEGRRSGAQPQPQSQPALRSINQAVKRGFAHQLGRRDRAGELMPSNNNTINDLILGRRNGTTSRRVKRNLANDLYQAMNDTAIDFSNDSLTSDEEMKRDSTINNWILGRNGTASSRRVKRNLAEDMFRVTEVNFTNESLTYGVENFINKTNGTGLPFGPASNSIMREKCSLLNFFTRFLQYF